MLKLVLLNLALLVAVVIGIIVCKKHVCSEKARNLLLIIAPVLTVICHYSSLFYHAFSDGQVLEFLVENCNLLLPVYPCNVVLWCCLIYGLLPVKNGRFGQYLADFIFWFGILASLVGMFANADFIHNPTFANFDAMKSVIAHAFMMFNVLLLPSFGKIKICFERNLLHIFISIILMFAIGGYCILLTRTVGSAEFSDLVNSMYLLHSPLEGLPWLKFPLISVCGVLVYAVLFFALDTFCLKKGERFIDRVSKK